MLFHDRLNNAMKRIGMTQARLADETGISKGSLSLYMSGKVTPKFANIVKLAQALDVSELYLLGQTDDINFNLPDQDFDENVVYNYKIDPMRKALFDKLSKISDEQMELTHKFLDMVLTELGDTKHSD